MGNTKMTDKQKVKTMADSDYVFGNFGGKVGQMSIPDFRSKLNIYKLLVSITWSELKALRDNANDVCVSPL